MTTTANKGGLRAAATAKREKAAQRTPLPAKVSPPETREDRIRAAQAKKLEKRLAEDAAAKAPAKAPKAVKVEAINDKGARYAGELEKLGWKPEVVRKDGLVELTATRGAEALYLSWFNEAHISGGSSYTYADHTVKVRNPAEAMRIASRTPDESKAVQVKVTNNKARYGKRSDGPSVRSVPFDVADVSAEDLIEAIRHHRITWHNQHRVESETAIVGDRVWVDRHAKGHRIVSFCDPEAGYRAFQLDNLENVGRKVNVDRIKQDIIASLSNDSKKSKRNNKS